MEKYKVKEVKDVYVSSWSASSVPSGTYHWATTPNTAMNEDERITALNKQVKTLEERVKSLEDFIERNRDRLGGAPF